MKTYNTTEIMKRAWRMYRAYQNQTWKWCLTRSWAIQKQNMQKVTPVELNRILQSLKPLRIAATQEHFNFLNSKKGKEIMRRDDADESKQMLSQGEICLNDILHKRRLESIKFNFQFCKNREPRKRIEKQKVGEKINIEEYVAKSL